MYGACAKENTPYRVTINVKERSDGEYVYSFSAERQNERPSTRRTLHADVTPSAESGKSNAQPSDTIVPTSDEKSNTKIAEQQRGSSDREILVGYNSIGECARAYQVVVPR